MDNPVRPEQDVFMKDEGLLHEVAVTSRKIATPSELREFFALLAHDETRFRCILDSALGREGLTESERVAAEVLGAGKVFVYRDSMRVWHKNPEKEPVVPFTREKLGQCAEENKNGADWRVIWVNGFSLREQEKIRGRNRKKQPCFDPGSTWWLEKAQDTWANHSVEAGYRLLDFSGRFQNMTWQSQEDAIRELGEGYDRAEEQAVVEACFTVYIVSGKKERLLKNFYHWGRLLTARGFRVVVGGFDEFGLDVSDYWDGDAFGGLRVVLSRKF